MLENADAPSKGPMVYILWEKVSVGTSGKQKLTNAIAAALSRSLNRSPDR